MKISEPRQHSIQVDNWMISSNLTKTSSFHLQMASLGPTTQRRWTEKFNARSLTSKAFSCAALTLRQMIWMTMTWKVTPLKLGPANFRNSSRTIARNSPLTSQERSKRTKHLCLRDVAKWSLEENTRPANRDSSLTSALAVPTLIYLWTRMKRIRTNKTWMIILIKMRWARIGRPRVQTDSFLRKVEGKVIKFDYNSI